MRHLFTSRLEVAVVSATIGAICGGMLAFACAFITAAFVADAATVCMAAAVGACCTVQ